MTTPAERIRILNERLLTTTPVAGEQSRLVSITWQIPPRPPSVVFIAEDELPDLVWRRENPDAGDVPEAIQAKGDEVRRLNIQQQTARLAARPARII